MLIPRSSLAKLLSAKRFRRNLSLISLSLICLGLVLLTPRVFAVNEGDGRSTHPAMVATLPFAPTAPRVAKRIPNNATTPYYTSDMIESDRELARIFGDPNAVAAANGFEPLALANQYPFYRGDVVADDGRRLRGHLSFAMHIYGSADGTRDSALYVPAGFTSHSETPTPTDAAITFYYPRLGNLNNVTLAVFHVANFAIRNQGGRIRIGNIGGAGGSASAYRHSHVEFYRGNTGLPAASLRESLRINPVSVFETHSHLASRSR